MAILVHDCSDGSIVDKKVVIADLLSSGLISTVLQ